MPEHDQRVRDVEPVRPDEGRPTCACGRSPEPTTLQVPPAVFLPAMERDRPVPVKGWRCPDDGARWVEIYDGTGDAVDDVGMADWRGIPARVDEHEHVLAVPRDALADDGPASGSAAGDPDVAAPEYGTRDNRHIDDRCPPGEHEWGTNRKGLTVCRRCNISRQTIDDWFDEALR